MFFAERGAKAPDHLTAEPVKVTTVAVVGGGTMGSGIAYACLSAGFKLCLLETDAHGVERAQHNVEKIISDSQQRGLLSDTRAGELRNNITYSTTYADAAQAELAIEAAFESIEVKRDVFQALEANLAPTAILASNTSYLDLNDIAGCVSDPSRVVGLHFFAPAHVMKLLEIIKGDATSDRAMATAFAMGKALRKIPVLAGVCDGFIGNRILTRYREAGDVLLMDGAVHWDVDEAMVEFGYAMGPYEVQDLSGLDIAYANRRRHDATRDPNRRYIPIADRMVQEGRLGKKTGVGWYRYPGGGGRVDDPLVEDLIREESHFAKVTRREIGKDEITKTLLLAMINEAANILYEGIAQSAADIDLVTVFGYGFPRWRGGLMHYADEVGVDNIVRDLTELAKTDPIAWAVSPALIHCAQAGITLMQYRR
jgi:3-hydroxyacyl-CoA dehydrogenase